MLNKKPPTKAMLQEQLKEKDELLTQSLIDSSSLSKRMLMGQAVGSTFNGDRDMYNILGYPDRFNYRDSRQRYDRGGISFRIINAQPTATWPNPPTIQEGDYSKDKTEMETAYESLVDRLNLYNVFERVDKLACIGSYSVLLVGVADGKELSEPLGKGKVLKGANGKSTKLPASVGINDIIYLQPYSEVAARIKDFDKDMSSPRYGMPETYELTTGGFSGGSSLSMSSKTVDVHHSRIIHIAWGTLENTFEGTPLLRPIANYLIDLDKVTGGSSETAWSNGKGIIHLNGNSEHQLKNPEALDKATEELEHKLPKVLRTKNMTAQILEASTYSPENHIKALLTLIAGTVAIPMRILTGSEMGTLASTQDKDNWLSRVDERRRNFCEKVILRPFIDKLIYIGALTPKEPYKVVWRDLISQSPKEVADVAFTVAKAVDFFTKGRAREMITDEQMMTDVLNLEYRKDELDAIKEANAKPPSVTPDSDTSKDLMK